MSDPDPVPGTPPADAGPAVPPADSTPTKSAASDSRRVAPKWLGKKIGRFRLQALLGQGAVGRVFRAEDAILHRRVALKVISIHSDDGQINKFVDQFLTEARAAAMLEHPHVVQIYEAGESGSLCYIAMELLDGGSLKDLVDAAGPMDPGRACLLTADAADALAAGHDAGIVHRDVKPANLMLSRQGRCKVTDFGLATFADYDSVPRERAAGTPLFAAPEVIRGTSADERSDIYSLGATLYYLLAGRPPFKARSRAEVLRMHVEEPVPDLRAIRPGLPESLVAAVERALDKDPGQRFPTAAQFARVLRVQTIPAGSVPAPAAVSASRGETLAGATVLDLSGMTAVAGSSGRLRGGGSVGGGSVGGGSSGGGSSGGGVATGSGTLTPGDLTANDLAGGRRALLGPPPSAGDSPPPAAAPVARPWWRTPAAAATGIGLAAALAVVVVVVSLHRPSADADATAVVRRRTTPPPPGPASTVDPTPASTDTAPYTFHYAVPAGTTVSAVNVVGDFNNWSPTATPMARRADGSFLVTVDLSVGRHPYKLVVDGKWTADPSADPALAVDDQYGGRNSVVDARPLAAAAGPTSTHTFRYVPPVGTHVSSVFVSGDFNGWSTISTPLAQGPDGAYTATVTVPDGPHHYKLFIDGRWTIDPAADPKLEIDDGFGAHNSGFVTGPGSAAP